MNNMNDASRGWCLSECERKNLVTQYRNLMEHAKKELERMQWCYGK
ncbi:MAG: hypothetical protein ACI35R_13375 [Bacillus sp. (in: firmicutes)]